MLEEFLIANRAAIIEGTRARVAARSAPPPTHVEITQGIPIFLDQLGSALHLARSSDVVDHHQMSASAGRHGRELFQMGLSLRQVVHDYGDVCQTITELAIRQKVSLDGKDFRILNLCLDDAIAEAVTEFANQRESELAGQRTERLGVFAHELRNLIHTAMISFEVIRSGRVGADGNTGLVLNRSLLGLSDLVDLTLADVRLEARTQRLEIIRVDEFVAEVSAGGLIHAQARGVRFSATSSPDAAIEGDRNILATTLANLLQNAFKFTRKHGKVSLTTRVTAERVLFEVQDECGGLPPGKAEELFRPYEQRASDRSGLGLGLSICRKAAHAMKGEIRVQSLPGEGCIFTLDLPRALAAPPPDAANPKLTSPDDGVPRP
jgi:signal transduction histidine kinase